MPLPLSAPQTTRTVQCPPCAPDNAMHPRAVLPALFLLAAAVFFLCWAPPRNASAQPPPGTGRTHFLLVHSYHPNMLWVQDINSGVQEVLGPAIDASNGTMRLSVEFMDTKRHPDAAYRADILALLRDKYAQDPPDVIITADNIALNTLLDEHEAIAPGSRVVFCGYNNYTPDALRGHDDVTGIAEKVSIRETIQAAAAMLPQTSRFIVISDRSETGRAMTHELALQTAGIPEHGRMELWDAYTFADLGRQLAALQGTEAIVLLSALQDTAGNVQSYRHSLRHILAATDRPVFAVFGFYADKGIVGGKLTDGVMQGREAARMALRIAQGTPPSRIPVITENINRFVFNHELLARYGISSDSIPAESTVLNRPPSFFTRYRQVLLPAGVLVALLVLALALESHHLVRQRAVEQSLREAKTRYRELVDNARSVIMHIDRNGQIEFINEYGLSFFGYEEHELTGKSVAATILPQNADGTPYSELLRRILENPETYACHENENIRKNGERVWISWLNRPLRDASGNVTGLLSAGQDATERKKAQDALAERERSYSVLLSNLPGMAFRRQTGGDGTFLFASEGCLPLTGFAPDDFVQHGRNLRGLAHPEDLPRITGAIDASPHRYAVEYRIIRSDGETRWVWEGGMMISGSGTSPCRSSGDSICVIEGFMTDITARVTARTELERLNEELEERVAARTAELQTSLEHLRQAQHQLVETEKMAALGGLVAGVAHEINTPIGIGVTSTSYLQEKMQQLEELYRSGGMKRSDIENFLRVGNESLTATRMNLSRAADLVRSFKQVAVDQSDEDTRRFNVLDYLEEVLVSLRPRYKRTSHRVELSGDKDLVITSYPGVFMQIVTNILTNALLHAFDGMENGVLSIHAVRQGNDLTLTLADNGKGMTPEILSRVFEPFFSTRRGNGGTGLGMHIVYNLVTRRLKGTVQCRSTPGDGTTFTITVPMQDSPSAVQT